MTVERARHHANARPVALVTGGTRGIGLGIALRLAQAGYDLAVCGTRPASAAAAALEQLRRAGATVLYVPADVADAAARTSLLEQLRTHFGRLNVLVNNAGVAPKVRADILEATPESFDYLLSTNLKGPYFLTQAVARWMIQQKQAAVDFSACIINISSVSATVASVNRGDYCISKAGVAMATRLWAARLGEYDIAVYEVRPGLIQTDMTAPVRDKYERMLAAGLAVQRRWGRPEDVGRVVCALACGAMPYCTGAVLMVDGGLTIPRL